MFVLSRKSQESVVVGGDDGMHRLFRVTVLGVSGGQVRLGFEVDPGVPVRRSEARERVHANGRPGRLMMAPAGSFVGYEGQNRFSAAKL